MVKTPTTGKWNEIKPGLDPTAFTIHTIKDRLKKKGDLLKGLFDTRVRIANSKILKSLV